MDTKVCTCCNTTKSLTDFSRNGDNFKSQCKECRNLKAKEYRKENLQKLRQKDKDYYECNKVARNAFSKKYCEDNKERILAYKKEYYEANKQNILEYHKNRKEERNQQKRERRKRDEIFALCEALKVRIHRVLKDKKNDRSWNYIGCTKDFLKYWIESQFTVTMTWDNYGDIWHIDHVIPIALFKLDNDISRHVCFHWSNLRPLYKTINLKKSKKVLIGDICEHNNTLMAFITNNGYQTLPEKALWLREELRYGKNPRDEFQAWLENEMGNPQPSS